MKMNPNTIATNLILLLLLQFSNISTFVSSMQRSYGKDKPEFTVRPNTATHIVVSNELFGLKKGNAGFVCAHGPKLWRKSMPGDRYNVLRFVNSGIINYKFIHCHIRSNLGFVNFPVYMHPDTSAHCHPSYICKYSIRRDGVHYKHENKFYPWQPFKRPATGRRSKAQLRSISGN